MLPIFGTLVLAPNSTSLIPLKENGLLQILNWPEFWPCKVAVAHLRSLCWITKFEEKDLKIENVNFFNRFVDLAMGTFV